MSGNAAGELTVDRAVEHDVPGYVGRYHPLESPHEAGTCTRCDEIRATPTGGLSSEVSAAAETDIGEPSERPETPERPELEILSVKLADVEAAMHYLTGGDVGEESDVEDFVDLVAMARRRLDAARAGR